MPEHRDAGRGRLTLNISLHHLMTDTDTSAETNNAPAPQQGPPQGPGFGILAQYIKDFSFENPRAPESLRLQGKPQVDLGVEMNAQGRADGLYEVDLKLSIKATQEDQPVFQIELVYCGLFQLVNVSEQEMGPVLLIECPRYLYPYARHIIANATADGGFYPPFQMEPIDFATIYQARMGATGGAGDPPVGQA